MTDYLIHRTKRNRAAHLWAGTDTVCRLYSGCLMAWEDYKVTTDKDEGHQRRDCLRCVHSSAAGVEVSPDTSLVIRVEDGPATGAPVHG